MLTKAEVSQLYVAIFNRASEGEGNAYWQKQGSISSVANQMLATSDAKGYFGTSLNTNQSFIEHIYKNTLNKTYTEDKSGIDYWVAQLNNGSSRGDVVASLINAIGSYAPGGSNYNATDTKTVTAYNQFNNRVSVSDYMADHVFSAPSDYASSTSFGGKLLVTDSKSSVSNSLNTINSTLSQPKSSIPTVSDLSGKYNLSSADATLNGSSIHLSGNDVSGSYLSIANDASVTMYVKYMGQSQTVKGTITHIGTNDVTISSYGETMDYTYNWNDPYLTVTVDVDEEGIHYTETDHWVMM